jgi:hypothetical protein
LVSLESSGNEDSEYVIKIFQHVCERNRNANRQETPFSRALWGKGANWPLEVVEMAPLYEFDENDRFFTTSCDSYVQYIVTHSFIIFLYTHFTIKRT